MRVGELIARPKKDDLAPVAVNEPPGPRSRLVAYWAGWQTAAALVFPYLRPNGTCGGSGYPDPKWMPVGSEPLGIVPGHRHNDTWPDCAEWEPRARATRQIT